MYSEAYKNRTVAKLATADTTACYRVPPQKLRRSQLADCNERVLLTTMIVAGMKTKTAIISIEKLTAEALPELQQAFKVIPGVERVDFSLERSVAVVEFDQQQSSLDDLLRAVLKAGYKVL